jgi:hypothetical protein
MLEITDAHGADVRAKINAAYGKQHGMTEFQAGVVLRAGAAPRLRGALSSA